MKKIIIVVALVSGMVCHVHAQGNTTYGVNTISSGSSNSYFGYAVGYFAIGGSHRNTAIGYNTLFYGGIENTAVGADALGSGQGCTAVGYQAMQGNCA